MATSPADEHHLPTPEDIRAVREQFPPHLIQETPLILHQRLSERHGIPAYVKDESAQNVRSYKIRGATARMLSLSKEERSRGVVCASAGNHAQGVAACCNAYQTKGTVFMPTVTPQQKIDATQRHGNGFVEITLHGDTYDETALEAKRFAHERGAAFLHPFDDPEVIKGQGTVALEIGRQMQHSRDRLGCVIVPVGGGGLLAGTILALEKDNPETSFVGVEPLEAASMTASLRAGHPVTLTKEHMETFVDGAAVARPGDITFHVIQRSVKEGRTRVAMVSTGLLCTTMADLFQIDGKLTEPAGALSIAALQSIALPTRDGVVCVLSGNNFDMRRIPSVLERAALYRRTKAYISLELPDRPNALREMLDHLGPHLGTVNISFMHFDDDHSNGTPAPLLMGLESKKGDPDDIATFLNVLGNTSGVHYSYRQMPAKPEL